MTRRTAQPSIEFRKRGRPYAITLRGKVLDRFARHSDCVAWLRGWYDGAAKAARERGDNDGAEYAARMLAHWERERA